MNSENIDEKIDNIFRNLTVEVIRTYNAFKACMEKNAEMTDNSNLKTLDCLILFVIESNNTPKPASVISTAFNYESSFNIDYSIKKLTKLKLIKKSCTANKKIILFTATKEGQNSVKRYMGLRSKIISAITESKHIKKHAKNAVAANKYLIEVRNYYQESLEIMCTYDLVKPI